MRRTGTAGPFATPDKIIFVPGLPKTRSGKIMRRLLRKVTSGVFDVAKEGGVAVTFAVGDKVYWDDTNNFAVATDGAGANKLLGKAVAAAADADTSVRVRFSQ